MSHLFNSPQNLSTFTKMFLVSLILITSIQVQAKVYKWIDENGKTHYSDKPFDEKSQVIKIKNQPSNPEISKAKKRAASLIDQQNKLVEIAQEDINEKKIADEKKEKTSAGLARICNDAKTEINMLGRGFRSYTEDKNGKRHYLSDKEKIENITALQKKIDLHCKNL